MCCDAVESSKARWLKQLGRKRRIYAWKVVRVSHQTLASVYGHGDYKRGLNEADVRCGYRMVAPRGFHVFRRRGVANVDARYRGCDVVIRVVCYKRDLIAADRKQGVFRRMTIPLAEWERAVATVQRKLQKWPPND